MSQICPSSSHQLAAAALAFHRARRKFIQNPCQLIHLGHEDLKSIQTSNKTENKLTRPRTASGCRNSTETTLDVKSVNGTGDCFDTVPSTTTTTPTTTTTTTTTTTKKMTFDDGKVLENNEEFKDAKDSFDNNSLQVYKNKNCSCYHKLKVNNEKHKSSLNLLSNDGFIENCVSDEDEPLSCDFSKKLYEWECRARQESLMKTQYFQKRVIEPQRDNKNIKNSINQKLSSRHHYCHCNDCQFDYQKSQLLNEIRSNCSTMSKESLNPLKRQRKNHSNDIKFIDNNCCKGQRHCLPIKEVDHEDNKDEDESTDDDDDNDDDDDDDDDVINNIRIINHKDSVDILVEKYKCQKINDNVLKNNNECILCKKKFVHLMSDQTTKECKIFEDCETTCCTQKNQSSNKLGDQLRQKCLRSRLTSSGICCSNEKPLTD